MNKLVLLFCTVLLSSNILYAQTDYSNRQRLSQRVSTLQSAYPNLVKTQSLVKTVGGSDIWMITIGTGQVHEKPAIAVVGGVEGKHLLGVELAMGFAETLLSTSSETETRTLLDNHTFYVFPNMSPDATEQYFATVQYERSGNARQVDSDRDGRVGEDGYDDLDGNGKITMMRVADPSGEHIINEAEPRSMIKADRAKGQFGQYSLFTEGIDNDKDGSFNEDGNEGISFNMNSTYNYKNFIAGAGEHAVSEVENRALFDFLYDAFNVYAVMTFGPMNNLSHPIQAPSRPATASAAPAGGRGFGMAPGRITAWSAEDAKANAFVAELYKNITATKDAPKTTAETGDFFEWAYYHYGRLSFSTPGWWVPKVAAEGGERTPARAGTTTAIEDPVADYLKWADAEGITGTFSDWKTVQHPDFEGKTVEVGGIHPFVLHNPPYHMVAEIVKKHTDFITQLASNAPFIEFSDVKTERLGQGVTRVTVKIRNTGLFPTLSQVGERSYFLKLLSVKVNTSGNQRVISGRPVQTLGSINGGESLELSWLIQGTGNINIEAGSPNTGSDKVQVSL